ncbi:AAA family ATPase [Candidatus Roizmanbacteria bacterium]|nr:AAA family ATPase [Candidatus Roizmanbacteria bacterium]
MAGFFDFIKKQPPKSTPKQSSPTPKSDNTTSQQPVVSQQTVTGPTFVDETQIPVKSGGSYSGIGITPGGGTPYSGIGNPPVQKSQVPISHIQSSSNDKVPSIQSNNATMKQSNNQPSTIHPPSSAKDSSTKSEDKEKSKTPEEKKREELDLMTHLTQRSNRVFLSAQTKAKELKNEYVDSEHLLHGLLSDSEIYSFLVELKIQPQLVEEELLKIYRKGSSDKIAQPSPRVKRILDNSLIIARKLGFEFISPEHILLGLYEEGEGAGARILAKLGLRKEDLNKKITGKKEGLEQKEKGDETKKNTLDQFTIDLTAKAAQGLLDPVVERSDVIERVIHILSRRTKNNPALVGEAGVGKTAIVEGLAQKIVAREVPEPLLNKKVLQLDLMSIIAGASHRGEFEERMKDLIEQVKGSQGQIILFIDEIHNIVGAGSSGGENALDASNFLKPALARGELQLIGATTLTEYRKYIEKDPALERRFQPVLVQEPTVEQAIKMLKAIKDKYEAFHRVKIPDEAIEAAVKFSKRYVGDRYLPDKAVDLIDEASSAVRLPLISLPEEIKSLETRVAELRQELQEAEKSGDKVKARIQRSKIDEIEANLKEKKGEYDMKKAQTTSAVSVEIIKDIVSRWTGIPVSKITESELEKLSNLEKIMHQRLIDQNLAVEAVAAAVRRGRAGLKSTQRPIGSFVFLGPTGVGKTELAKTLAEILFGQEEAMIRFDMTEYMERHEVAKLLGAPPGYVGYEEGGKLTESVRRKPYSVVLFDEVEKAHPDIFNILLQILDDGRLTDNKGRVISFKNSVVVCTSNIGTRLIQDELIKSGKTEIEEPPMLSTYTFSPRGREILTIGAKYFERDSTSAQHQWQEGMLLDYFAGQKIESKDKVDFPINGFDTHAISSKGVEVLTKGDTMYHRTSTTAKVWQTTNLIDYFKDGVVINALPDVPEEQLPTARFKTHTFTPEEKEIVTYKDRYWLRKEGTNDWQTGHLKEYFANETKMALPIAYWDIHAFSPVGKETVILGDKIWFRNPNDKAWKVQTLKEYFGKDFPLEKELEEKRKVDEEVDKKKYDIIKSKVTNELRRFFRPELLNRFDEVIIFEPLKFFHMMEIVKLQLNGVGKLLEDQDIGFTYTEASVKEIVREGFDPVYGARPLRRAIQKLIENPMSTLIIEKKVKAGDQIVADFDGENFVFNIEKVELISEDQLKKQTLKNFFCETCGQHFKTEMVKNSTVICSKCASKKVQEVIETPTSTIQDEKSTSQMNGVGQTQTNNFPATHA